ncbi:MAG: SMP-30/gluconolactonase/LRE family protein [Hyphomonadaceae bacterium]|nr:SMP-30/gluconolactonase/LRE family protein [Hyphomonadaceae bacterium]
MKEAVCVAPTGCMLGEGPLWSPSEGFLWWVDIKRAKLHRHNPKTGNTRRYDLPLHASALALAEGGLIMIGDLEVGRYDTATEHYECITKINDQPGFRTNDAGIAPDGSLWFGTMDNAEELPEGQYYRLAPDQTLDRIGLPEVLVTNTFQFSPDGTTFYTSDSAEQMILAYTYDRETGALSNRRVFASTLEAGCYPDGSAIDADGYLWNAQWAGSRVVRYAPDGSIDRIVKLPVSRPSSCAFGGPDLKTLYITSARVGLSDAALDRQPMAGSLFALDVDTPGLPVPEFGQPRSN